MDNRRIVRAASAPAEDRPPGPEEAAELRALSRSALRLRTVLRTGSDEALLRHSVAAYVACATARGVSRRRIREALELFVHERPPAGRHPLTNNLLDFVLRLASDAEATSAHQLREVS